MVNGDGGCNYYSGCDTGCGQVVWYSSVVAVQNIPLSQDETDEYSGDDDEVKHAMTTLPHDKKKPQLEKEKVQLISSNDLQSFTYH